jgi:hypothetical protein
MKFIIAQLVPYIQPDQDTASNTGSKTDNIYQAIQFVFAQAAKRHFQIVLKHNRKIKKSKLKRKKPPVLLLADIHFHLRIFLTAKFTKKARSTQKTFFVFHHSSLCGLCASFMCLVVKSFFHISSLIPKIQKILVLLFRP